ncbi:UNVERIFIED_CONTAM: hypothetical protein FKN15_072214 [Acipenser sinensis]
MGAFGAVIGILHFMGLYIQLNASSKQAGYPDMENHISGNVFLQGVYEVKDTQRPCRAEQFSVSKVVKVAGSNISHKLRLSSVKPSDEGTYECRVIDFSDGKARHHKVRAYLQVEPNQNSEPQHHSTGHRPQETKAGSLQSNHGKHAPTHSHHKGGRELKKHSAENANDCTDSCVL